MGSQRKGVDERAADDHDAGCEDRVQQTKQCQAQACNIIVKRSEQIGFDRAYGRSGEFQHRRDRASNKK